MNTQIIEQNGKPAFAIVPFDEWKALLEKIEDTQDIADANAARDDEEFPLDFVRRLVEGDQHPLVAWRKYRGLSLQSLAQACGVTKQMLSAIGRRRAKPSSALLARLACELRCNMEDLLPE